MKTIAFFDTKPYDCESFEQFNNGRYDIRFFESRLTAAALPLAKGCDAACAFVNAEIDREVVDIRHFRLREPRFAEMCRNGLFT